MNDNKSIDYTIALEQWKTCVEMANSVSQRRDTMNNIFVTLNLAVVATASVTWSIKSVLILVAGIAICILWALFIRYYKQLNTVKFELINEIEKSLPFQPFTQEWEALNGQDKYIRSTKLEKILSVAFIVLYIILMVILFSQKGV